jgi:hypothetical protein
MLRVVLFLSVLTALVGSASLYVLRRATRTATLGRRGRRALAAVVVAGVAATVGSRLLERSLPAGVLVPFGVAGAVVTVAVVISALLLGLIDAVSLVLGWLARRMRPARPASPASPADPQRAPAPPEEASPRRVFLGQATTGSALVIGVVSSTYGSLFGRHDYQLEETSFAIPGLSRRLDGYTLVQLSDIHLGMFVGEAEMRAAEEMVARARPDLLVLTGDLIDHDARHTDALGRLVRRLAPYARHGVVAVPGNHDYYTGIDAVVSTLSSAGAVVLRNGGLVVGDAGASFALLGVDDPWGPRDDPRAAGPDLGAALAALPAAADLPRVLLCHNPVYFPEAAGKVALQLSGHTHGGQIKLGVSPAPLILRHRFIAGRYERAGSGLYVNRGFGTAGPPTRVGAPPEVTRIVLTT